VVLGTRGLSGIERFLLGSVSEHVLTHGSCSVLVVRGFHPRGNLRQTKRLRVLLATDGSPHARAAVALLGRFGLPRVSGCPASSCGENGRLCGITPAGSGPVRSSEIG
jgi:hypothetical protein